MATEYVQEWHFSHIPTCPGGAVSSAGMRGSSRPHNIGGGWSTFFSPRDLVTVCFLGYVRTAYPFGGCGWSRVESLAALGLVGGVAKLFDSLLNVCFEWVAGMCA